MTATEPRALYIQTVHAQFDGSQLLVNRPTHVHERRNSFARTLSIIISLSVSARLRLLLLLLLGLQLQLLRPVAESHIGT